VIECEPYGQLVKEVREIIEGGTSLEEAGPVEGPYVPGISRIWMYGYLNGGKVYYDTTMDGTKDGKILRSVPLVDGENIVDPCKDMRSGWYVYGKCLDALPFNNGRNWIEPENVIEFWDECRKTFRRKRRLMEGEARD